MELVSASHDQTFECKEMKVGPGILQMFRKGVGLKTVKRMACVFQDMSRMFLWNRMTV